MAEQTEAMWRLWKEMLTFVGNEKKCWLAPLSISLLPIAILILFAGSSVLALFVSPFL